MTNLTEAEKAHGWVKHSGWFSNVGDYGDVWVYRTDIVVWVGGEDIVVWVGGEGGGAPLYESELDALILALLQAKGIHRRMVAEMTNTTHEGER